MSSFLGWLKIKGNLIALMVSVLLIWFIAFLIVANYMSECKLHKSALEYISLDIENSATAVSYFCSDRLSRAFINGSL